jgi:hypothetical protein
VLRWTLDAPLPERVVDTSSGQIRVQGWLLKKEASEFIVQVLVRSRGGEEATSPVQRILFNNGRPDVIRRVLGEVPDDHSQLRCGFTLTLPVSSMPVEIGFDLGNGAEYWAVRIELTAAAKVIEGPDGWLFLDNDTNRSVDQHSGRLQLDAAGLRQWRAYLAEARALAEGLGARHSILVAPSKEEVLRDYYPHPRAAITVLDQVRALAKPSDHFVDAAAVLAAQPRPADLLKRTDTHWTDRGAMLATLAVIRAMGYNDVHADAAFADDRYRIEPFAGDLGIKLLPPRSEPTEFLDGPSPEVGAVFDNGLPNMGRVLVFETGRAATFDANLMVFGASSGFQMLKYLKRLFRRVVFVHSAGNIDVSLARQEWPDALLMQSNGRFLVQPPRADASLRVIAKTKLAEGGEALQARIDALLAQGPRTPRDAPYFEMLKV